MTRIFPLSVLTILFASALSAQDDVSPAGPAPEAEPVIVEMKIQRSLGAGSNGIADMLDSVQADTLILHYELTNESDGHIEIARAAISEEINGAAVIVIFPEERLAPHSSTSMVIEVTPLEAGPFSFTVSMALDGEAYTFPVLATVIAVLHGSDHHCHWWGCHSHHDHDDHHCSTGESSNWMMLGGVVAALAGVMVRRRLA